jgi:hypothetical protein
VEFGFCSFCFLRPRIRLYRAENFIKQHVETHKLRSEGEVKRFLAKYFLPLWEDLVLALRFEPQQAGTTTVSQSIVSQTPGLRHPRNERTVLRRRLNVRVPPCCARGRRRKLSSSGATSNRQTLTATELDRCWSLRY